MIEHAGPGWRLARDPARGSFPFLIGGEGWAFELTQKEWAALVLIIRELSEQHLHLDAQLMSQESICLEMEKGPWWCCLDGDRDSWSLQFILQGDGEGARGIEGYWSIPAAQAIASAMTNFGTQSID